MKRIVCVFVLAVVCVLAFAPAAQAQFDYRPWKQAMQRAYSIYFDRYWMPVTVQNHIWDCYITGLTAPDWHPYTNRWDAGSCEMATMVTAFWYAVPNGEWGPPLRQQLRPFLRRHPPTASLPRPPIIDAYPHTVIRP